MAGYSRLWKAFSSQGRSHFSYKENNDTFVSQLNPKQLLYHSITENKWGFLPKTEIYCGAYMSIAERGIFPTQIRNATRRT